MLEIISWFVIGFIYNIMYCYFFSKICTNKSLKITKKSIYLSLIFAFVNCYTIYFDVEMRPFIITISYFMVLNFSYKINYVETLLILLFLSIVSAISEMLCFYFFISILKIKPILFDTSLIHILIVNILVIILMFIVVKTKIINKSLKVVLKWNKNNKLIKTVFMFLIVIISMCTLLYPISKNGTSIFEMFLNSIFVLCIIIFVYGYFKQKAYNNKLISEYDNLLKYSKIYSKVINEKSKNQHEHKNQLRLIKGMIVNEEDNVVEYIDGLLNQKDSDSKHEWLNNLSKIPNGGLQGLICYNIDEAVDKGLISFVSVSDKINTKKVKNLFNDYLKDLSIILGVYLSNAIEAALECDKKFVTIDFKSDDDNIIISISNTFNNLQNISKMHKENFTTKGINHGYGLSLVKDIVDRNKIFSVNSEINGIYFVQKILIKK